jgi:hypothetical protein
MTKEQAQTIERVMKSGAEVMRSSGTLNDRAASVTMDCVALLAQHIAEAVDELKRIEVQVQNRDMQIAVLENRLAVLIPAARACLDGVRIWTVWVASPALAEVRHRGVEENGEARRTEDMGGHRP